VPDRKKKKKDAAINVEKNNVSENAIDTEAKGLSALILVVCVIIYLRPFRKIAKGEEEEEEETL
jgi:hypothetical protein